MHTLNISALIYTRAVISRTRPHTADLRSPILNLAPKLGLNFGVEHAIFIWGRRAAIYSWETIGNLVGHRRDSLLISAHSSWNNRVFERIHYRELFDSPKRCIQSLRLWWDRRSPVFVRPGAIHLRKIFGKFPPKLFYWYSRVKSLSRAIREISKLHSKWDSEVE